MEKVETLSLKDVADAFGTKPMKIKKMIINGTMPIGGVAEGEERDRIIVVKKRFEKWINGEL